MKTCKKKFILVTFSWEFGITIFVLDVEKKDW